jgi:pseudouridine-5'-phosphate glycosidase
MPPPVALESTVIAHGLPHPVNVDTALALEECVRAEGAHPQTIGIIGGQVHVGLTEQQIRQLGTADAVRKVSLRDLPVVGAGGKDGATTVAGTLHLAHRAGIRVMATGGIGGVHRTADGAPAWDVSADLEALRRTPMAVVCSGPKVILDLDATREVLESYGVTVVGYQTDAMPAFYSPSSARPVDVRCDTPGEVAALLQAQSRLDCPGAVLVTVPPPAETALPRPVLEPVIGRALADAAARELAAAELTPFLLKRLREIKGDQIVAANRALLERNATVAARIAQAVA